MFIQGTRGAPPLSSNGLMGSQAQLQSLSSGMHRHSPGPVPMPGTGPTDDGGGGVGPEGGQDPHPEPNGGPGGTPDGSSGMNSSDGVVNIGPRAWPGGSAAHSMVASANNNNSAPDHIDNNKFRGGPDQCYYP